MTGYPESSAKSAFRQVHRVSDFGGLNIVKTPFSGTSLFKLASNRCDYFRLATKLGTGGARRNIATIAPHTAGIATIRYELPDVLLLFQCEGINITGSYVAQ
jgi:hypothetical protein